MCHLTPLEVRLRNLTYESELRLDIEYNQYQIEGEKEVLIRSEKKENCPLGRIPILVKSDFCLLKNNKKYELIGKGECPYD